MTALTVEYRKWPARLHYRTEMTLLSADSAGLWAGSRRGAPVVHADGARSTLLTEAVTLFPRERAWSARWYAQPTAAGRASRYRFYLDLTTPATVHGTHLSLVDLDLDLAVTWDGEVVALDEDEFAEHRMALGYPESVVRQALDTFEEMRGALVRRAFPLDGVAAPYLAAWFGSDRATSGSQEGAPLADARHLDARQAVVGVSIQQAIQLSAVCDVEEQ